MAVLRSAGGPYGQGAFRFTWQGATVQQAWLEQVEAGMQAEAAEVLNDLRQSIHVVTGEMRDKAFARVEVAGTKRQIVAGSEADHAAYEELGTVYRPGHPQIRGVMDRAAPKLTRRIAEARKGGR
ncbi:MAG: hypothetical protein AB7P40_00325 [Chloroflexota bacterium]